MRFVVFIVLFPWLFLSPMNHAASHGGVCCLPKPHVFLGNTARLIDHTCVPNFTQKTQRKKAENVSGKSKQRDIDD